MNVIRPPTPSPPLARFSRAWFNSKYTRWKEQPPTLKLIQVLLLMCCSIILLQSSWKFAWGLIYYFLEYSKAALGHDVLTEPCVRIMKEVCPWRDLKMSEYWRYMRCTGNEDGWESRGKLVPTPSGVLASLFNPYAFSSWVRIAVVGSCTRFFYFMWRPILNKFILFVAYLLERLIYIWGNHNWVFDLIPISIIWLCTNWALALLCGSMFLFRAWQLTRMTIVDNGFAPPEDPLQNDLTNPTDGSPTDRNQCLHVDPCTCFNAWVAGETRHRIEMDQLRINVGSLESQLRRATRERDGAYNRTQPTGQTPTMGAFVADPPNDRIHSEFDRAQRRVAELEQEKDNWILEKNNLRSKYTTEIVKWKEQIDYARGAGENMLVAVTEVDDLKAKIRMLQRDNQALIEAGMQTRQALAAEREIHSEKCQDEAGCQMKISALEYKCRQLLDSHAYNDKMVVDAAIKFGMPKEDASHMDLMAYLRAVTIEVARLKALGVEGLGATNTVDFTIKQLEEELQRTRALKNRLEREVDRLGGNVIAIRNGWDTTKPKDWSIDLNATYEDNAYRMFPIYERLCQVVVGLTDTLVNSNEPLPVWAPEVPRNDQTSRSGFVPTPQHLLEANKITNSMATSSEDLTQKLTVNEVQRLYNRALQLAVRIRNLSPKELLPSGEKIVHDPGVREMLRRSDRVFKDVLVGILDDIRPVIASPTEQAPDPRMQKKFGIYTAMQEAIQALTNSIVANGHIPPQWITHFEQQSKPWSSPDNLALNLMNSELRILEVRINQLLTCMIELKLPGTAYGTPLLEGHILDPDYNARWYELVAATSYARLVLSHWHLHLDQKNVQIKDEKTGELKTITVPAPTIMPLTSKDRYFRDALNRGESEKEKAAREIKEGIWPHPDVIQSTTWFVPGIGHQIYFKVLDPNKKNDHNTDGSTKYTQDENNSNSDDRGGNNDYDKVRKEWETKKRRVNQLKNYVLHYNIKGNKALPNVNAPLRKNMSSDDIERANHKMDHHISQMASTLTQAGYQVPKIVHKGGKMHPDK